MTFLLWKSGNSKWNSKILYHQWDRWGSLVSHSCPNLKKVKTTPNCHSPGTNHLPLMSHLHWCATPSTVSTFWCATPCIDKSPSTDVPLSKMYHHPCWCATLMCYPVLMCHPQRCTTTPTDVPHWCATLYWCVTCPTDVPPCLGMLPLLLCQCFVPTFLTTPPVHLKYCRQFTSFMPDVQVLLLHSGDWNCCGVCL